MTQIATMKHEKPPYLSSCFETEVAPHIAALYRYALRLCRNKMDADDLVQEALLRAFRFWGRFIPGSNCRAWLFVIIKNQHVNDYRIEVRRPAVVSIDDVEDYLLIRSDLSEHASRTPDRDLLDKCLDDDLANAVSELGDEFREVVVLYHLHGLSYKQIANQSELRLGTIKSRLYRGRKMLRVRLRKYARRNRNVTDCH